MTNRAFAGARVRVVGESKLTAFFVVIVRVRRGVLVHIYSAEGLQRNRLYKLVLLTLVP